MTKKTEKQDSWVFAGVYCARHIPQTVKALGKALVVIVQTEQISHDERCSVVNCGEFIQFVAFRDIEWELVHAP